MICIVHPSLAALLLGVLVPDCCCLRRQHETPINNAVKQTVDHHLLLLGTIKLPLNYLAILCIIAYHPLPTNK